MRLAVTAVGISGMGVAQILDSGTVSTIASTIQNVEGYYPGSLAYTNNNPGNLVYVGQPGASPGAGGFAKFPSYQDGLNALHNQIQIYASRGMTIQQMMDVYAPASAGNDPAKYANTIATALGVPSDTSLTDLPLLPSENVPSMDMNVNPVSGDVNWPLVGLIAAAALLAMVSIGD